MAWPCGSGDAACTAIRSHAVFLGQRVALVPGVAAVDRRMPGLLRHMRCDTGLPQVTDEVGARFVLTMAASNLARLPRLLQA